MFLPGLTLWPTKDCPSVTRSKCQGEAGTVVEISARRRHKGPSARGIGPFFLSLPPFLVTSQLYVGGGIWTSEMEYLDNLILEERKSKNIFRVLAD